MSLAAAQDELYVKVNDDFRETAVTEWATRIKILLINMTLTSSGVSSWWQRLVSHLINGKRGKVLISLAAAKEMITGFTQRVGKEG